MSREEEKTEQRGILGLAEAFVGTLSFSWRRTGPPSPPVDSGAFDSPNSPGPAKSTSEPDTSTHTKNPSPPYPKPTPTSPTTTPSPSQTQSTSTLGVPTVTTVRGISLHDTTPPRVPLIDVSKLRRITREEVATHNTKRDCWVILHGLVLDVTKYAPFHPGGSRFIIQSAGKDISADFDALRHSVRAKAQLPQYVVGVLAEDSAQNEKTKPGELCIEQDPKGTQTT